MVVSSTIGGFPLVIGAYTRPWIFHMAICAASGQFYEEIHIPEWFMGRHRPMHQAVYYSSRFASGFGSQKTTPPPTRPGTWAYPNDPL